MIKFDNGEGRCTFVRTREDVQAVGEIQWDYEDPAEWRVCLMLYGGQRVYTTESLEEVLRKLKWTSLATNTRVSE